MKKAAAICLVFCSFLIFTPFYSVSAQSENPEKVQLTEAQKTEISKLQKEILADKKELVEKYAEYGAISKEEAERMKLHFDKQYDMMKKHNFQIPLHHGHHHHMPKQKTDKES